MGATSDLTKILRLSRKNIHATMIALGIGVLNQIREMFYKALKKEGLLEEFTRKYELTFEGILNYFANEYFALMAEEIEGGEQLMAEHLKDAAGRKRRG